MPAEKINELNNIQMDVLKEIGNIGSGNAATSLALMIGSDIDITIPIVKTMDYHETAENLGGLEAIVIGLLVRFSGDIKGLVMYLLQQPFVDKVISTFYGKAVPNLLEMDEMDISAISEIGNIVSASYVNAIAQLSGLTIDISVPSIAIDMVGAILSVPVTEFAEMGSKVIFIDDKFVIDEKSVRSNMILIPEAESLKLLFDRLGVSI